MQVAKPNHVARAPRGKEVEDLTPEEIRTALAQSIPISEIEGGNKYAEISKGLKGTLEGIFILKDGKQIEDIPVSEIVEKLKEQADVDAIIFDGIITGRLVDAAVELGVSTLIGERIAESVRVPNTVKVKTFKNL